MSDSREEFEKHNLIPSDAYFCDKHQMYKHKQYKGVIAHPINEIWESFCEGIEWQAAKPEFTALCHSKTRRIGIPVGFLVKSEAGSLAAVHNLGRVTWLDDCVAGPVEREDRAQDGGAKIKPEDMRTAEENKLVNNLMRDLWGAYTDNDPESELTVNAVWGLLVGFEANVLARAQDGGSVPEGWIIRRADDRITVQHPDIGGYCASKESIDDDSKIAPVILYHLASALISSDSKALSAVVPDERGANEYGLDVGYFRKLFNRELSSLRSFRPDELARVLARAARTADASVLQESEFQAGAVVPEDEVSLQDAANKVCKHLPEGFELRLCMKNGAAWVELSDDHGDGRTLPEIDDVCLEAQLNNALCVACGWTEQEQES